MYQDMAQLLHPAKNGKFKLELFDIKPGNFWAVLDGISQGTYVRLMHNGSVVMSNTDMEKRTNFDFCIHAYGDVLIGGLGIGMILLAIQDDPKVKSITVLEKYQEVIDMVVPQLPLNNKIKIICADVFDWKPERGQRFDCIYMDIWNFINTDVYQDEMKPLKRKYGHYLKRKDDSPKRFNKCWAEYQAKNGRRL